MTLSQIMTNAHNTAKNLSKFRKYSERLSEALRFWHGRAKNKANKGKKVIIKAACHISSGATAFVKTFSPNSIHLIDSKGNDIWNMSRRNGCWKLEEISFV